VERGQIPDIQHSPSFLSPNLSSGGLCMTASESTSGNQLSQCALSISSGSPPNDKGSCRAWTSSEGPLGSSWLPCERRVAASSTLSCSCRQTWSTKPSTYSTTSAMGSPTGEPQTRLELFSKSAGGCRKKTGYCVHQETGSCVHEAQSQRPPGMGSDSGSAG